MDRTEQEERGRGRGRDLARKAAGTLIVVVLLFPSMLGALAWTPINLIVAVIAIGVLWLVTKMMPWARWYVFPLVLVAIAIPPYPHWIWHTERGWILRIGAQVRDPLGAGEGHLVFMLIFVGVLLWLLQYLMRRHVQA
ncbi:hypothetical protein LAG73_04415 [Pseudoxanthomonas japonensis]|nr:hypothetical protein LAG73_04415 [Pseudoxanthomonas japonensis]